MLPYFCGKESGIRRDARVFKEECTNGNRVWDDSAAIHDSVKIGYTLCSRCSREQLDHKLARRNKSEVGRQSVDVEKLTCGGAGSGNETRPTKGYRIRGYSRQGGAGGGDECVDIDGYGLAGMDGRSAGLTLKVSEGARRYGQALGVDEEWMDRGYRDIDGKEIPSVEPADERVGGGLNFIGDGDSKLLRGAVDRVNNSFDEVQLCGIQRLEFLEFELIRTKIGIGARQGEGREDAGIR